MAIDSHTLGRDRVSKSVILSIRGYQRWVSPLLGPACRFHPSCSEYAAEAVDRYGAVQGCALGVRRLLRCHPLCEGGIDPVP